MAKLTSPSKGRPCAASPMARHEAYDALGPSVVSHEDGTLEVGGSLDGPGLGTLGLTQTREVKNTRSTELRFRALLTGGDARVLFHHGAV